MHLCCLCTQTPLAFQCRDGRALSDETADASPIWRIRSDALSASISPLSISCKIRDHRRHDGGQEPGGSYHAQGQRGALRSSDAGEEPQGP